MLRIGDFSQLGQVSVRTLRLYDELGLLKPAQIDRFTDYRYYQVEQLPRLNRILALKDLGLSLEQIRALIDKDLPISELRGMLKMKQADLEKEVNDNLARLARVQARLKMIEAENRAPAYDVVIKAVERQTIAGMRQVIPNLDVMTAYRCKMYDDLYHALAAAQLETSAPEFAVYHLDEYREQDIDMETATALDKISARDTQRAQKYSITVRDLPAEETMACYVHHGAMSELPLVVSTLFGWIGANGYASNGATRELHHFGREIDHVDFNSVVVEIQIPITRN